MNDWPCVFTSVKEEKTLRKTILITGGAGFHVGSLRRSDPPSPAESYWGNVNSIGRRACYDKGKCCAETLCFDYYRQHSLPIKVARIFNTYGPRMYMHDGRMVSNFIVQALQNQPITSYGNGSQTRAFC